MIEIWLPGKGVGKARPRMNTYTGRIHMGGAYAEWKAAAIRYLKRRYPDVKLPEPCRISCSFVNFKSSDSDNLTGSVLDALVQAGLLSNDSSSFVVSSSGSFVSIRKPRNIDKPKGILIKVEAAEIESMDYQAIASLLWLHQK